VLKQKALIRFTEPPPPPKKKSSCDTIPLKWKEQRPPVLEPSSTLFAFGARVQYWGGLRRRKRTHVEQLYQTTNEMLYLDAKPYVYVVLTVRC
jgi:hypothetical protein